MARYAPKYRPPDTFTLPRKPWRIIETGSAFELPRRPDLRRGPHRFGVVEFDEPLTPEEIDQWELKPV